eukprot:COSAG01_NODE_45088_length_412_cov_4.201278_1_plen_117_part_01
MSFHKDIICVACVRSIQSAPCNHKICLTSETCCSLKFSVCSTKTDPTEFYRLWLMTHEKFLVVPYVYDCSCTRTVVAAVFTCPILSQSMHDGIVRQQQQYLTDAARLKKCTSTVQSY